MSVCQATLSANAGVALQLGRARLWVDALHESQTPGFSTISPRLADEVLAHPDFAEPELLFFTHCHGDHFSRELTERVMARWPGARLVLPEAMISGQTLLLRPREELDLPELSLRFVRLPHEGTQYADVAHYGCVAEREGFRVLITGDCAVAAPELAEFLAEVGPVDLALMDFPWITLKKGRRFIQEKIRPRHLLVCHLPFAQDDVFGYRQAANAAAALVEVPDVRLLREPLQRESIE